MIPQCPLKNAGRSRRPQERVFGQGGWSHEAGMLRQSLNGERLILGGHAALRSRRGAQGIGLVVTFLVLAGMRQRALGEGLRLLQMTGQELRLAQSETTERLQVDSFQRHGLLHPPLEQWY